MPLSRGKDGAAVDDGPLYDSTDVMAGYDAVSAESNEFGAEPSIFLPFIGASEETQ